MIFLREAIFKEFPNIRCPLRFSKRIMEFFFFSLSLKGLYADLFERYYMLVKAFQIIELG